MCEAMMLGNSSRGTTVSTQSCLALVAHQIRDDTMVKPWHSQNKGWEDKAVATSTIPPTFKE
jgi:hypothetical protein